MQFSVNALTVFPVTMFLFGADVGALLEPLSSAGFGGPDLTSRGQQKQQGLLET